MASGLTESSDLVLEDGTGVATANSYMSRASVLTYVNLRQDVNLLPWTLADESNQVAALIIATQYLDTRWKFAGSITYPGDDVLSPQALEWPRETIIDHRGVTIEDDELPPRLLDALAEYASRAIDPDTNEARQLRVDLVTEDTSGRRVKETFDRIGPLIEQVKYDSRSAAKFPDYGNADELMKRSGFIVLAGERTVRA